MKGCEWQAAVSLRCVRPVRQGHAQRRSFIALRCRGSRMVAERRDSASPELHQCQSRNSPPLRSQLNPPANLEASTGALTSGAGVPAEEEGQLPTTTTSTLTIQMIAFVKPPLRVTLNWFDHPIRLDRIGRLQEKSADLKSEEAIRDSLLDYFVDYCVGLIAADLKDYKPARANEENTEHTNNKGFSVCGTEIWKLCRSEVLFSSAGLMIAISSVLIIKQRTAKLRISKCVGAMSEVEPSWCDDAINTGTAFHPKPDFDQSRHGVSQAAAGPVRSCCCNSGQASGGLNNEHSLSFALALCCQLSALGDMTEEDQTHTYTEGQMHRHTCAE
ncbi:hypothetical protein F2P79_011394 [Pimephales promelas]|nr:hypothetical protein F2P79_011394 [Pimephales promelas]